MSSIFVIGIFLCAFLSVLLFSKAPKRLPDNILGVWLLSIATYLLNYYLHYLGYWEKYPHLVGATHPFPLLFAPFIYLYVVTNLRQPQRLYWQDSLHFFPFTGSPAKSSNNFATELNDEVKNNLFIFIFSISRPPIQSIS